MSIHLVTSHGGDFFGQDRHPLDVLQQIAPWVDGWGDTREAGKELRTLLESTGAEPHTIPAARAAVYAELLLHSVRTRFYPKKLAAPTRLLADAAARAAADGQPWTWTTEDGQ